MRVGGGVGGRVGGSGCEGGFGVCAVCVRLSCVCGVGGCHCKYDIVHL